MRCDHRNSQLVGDVVPHVTINKTAIGKGGSYSWKSDCSESKVLFGISLFLSNMYFGILVINQMSTPGQLI